jgi:hypothetical protein
LPLCPLSFLASDVLLLFDWDVCGVTCHSETLGSAGQVLQEANVFIVCTKKSCLGLPKQLLVRSFLALNKED